MTSQGSFSHLDTQGAAHMVDVSEKPVTRRVAEASCRVLLSAQTLIRLANLPKGDAFAVSRLAHRRDSIRLAAFGERGPCAGVGRDPDREDRPIPATAPSSLCRHEAKGHGALHADTAGGNRGAAAGAEAGCDLVGVTLVDVDALGRQVERPT